jgi:1-deoxy-D-xylulose-5-phosphate reductoisomerase
MEVASTRLRPVAAPRKVTVLGSTGSIGRNTVDLIERDRSAFEVEALTAHKDLVALVDQARRLRPAWAVTADEGGYGDLKAALAGTGIEVAAGQTALIEAAERPADLVMAAIVGAAGLAPTLAAVRRGATIALANKETLVCAGALMVAEITRHGATLLPVDSEHNAIFQVLETRHPDAVDRIVLTASGGPFRELSREAMAEVTPEQAVAHPNWDMGAKISVDSATMMNKGLELIEAHHLFGFPEPRIEILVHPQSVVHSMVSYIDGSVLAQLGQPDMRTPIAYALAWPARMAAPVEQLDLAAIGQLTFEAPDPDRFPALRLARQALRAGGSAPTVLNAANEIAVEGFLNGKNKFLEIAEIVEGVLEALPAATPSSLDEVQQVDREARDLARRLSKGG